MGSFGKKWRIEDLQHIKGKAVLPKETKSIQVLKLSEDELQVICVKWFKFAYPEYSRRIFHPPNGGSRNAIEAKKLKDMGVLPGVCDIIVTIPKGDYHGLFVEMKVGNNDLSQYQEEFIKEHEKDYYCIVCYTEQEFKEGVRKYLKM